MKQLKNIVQLIFVTFLVGASTLCWAQVPAITSFTPTSGPIGTEVTITGTNFDPTPEGNIVYFGAVQASVNSALATELIVTVPAGTSYHPISVLTNGLQGFSSEHFIVSFGGDGVDVNSFDPNIDYTSGSKPYEVENADFDGDGKVDIAVVNYQSNSLSLYTNTSSGEGDISFDPKVDFTTGTSPTSLSVADLDGDGRLDIAVTNAGNNMVSVFRNTSTLGSINFAARVNFSTQSNPQSIAIKDLDKDGKQDIAIANYNSNTVSVLRNISSGAGSINFAFNENFSTGGASPISIAIGDIDGDDKGELLLANASGSISMLRNTSVGPGSISFAPWINYNVGSTILSASIGDIDSDGKNDIAVVSYNTNTVFVYRNISTVGNINFSPAVPNTTSINPYAVAISDIDGDGKVDLGVVNRGSNSISILKNTSTVGSISLASKVDFAVGTEPNAVSIGDFDGDGKSDLAATNYTSWDLSVLRNTILKLPPTITSFTPSEGPEGTVVTITGTNFDPIPSNNTVLFKTTSATVTSASAIQLVVPVPLWGRTGPITVTVNGESAVSSTDFTVAPKINSFTPLSGTFGSTLTILGTNFDETPSNNIVFVGGAQATVLTATISKLTISVPEAATTGTISVEVAGQTGISSSDFTYHNILSFSFPEETGAPVIDGVNHTVFAEVAYGTSLLSLTPTIELSSSATIAPLSGVVQDFTNPIIYTITQQDGFTTQDWTVTVLESLPSFVDARDGNSYKYVDIGNQTWMAENLAYLPNVIHPSNESPVAPFYYVYSYFGPTDDLAAAKENEYYDTYGVLYNWTAAMGGSGSSSANPSGIQGVCPSGWHLPSSAEWAELETLIGGPTEGGKLKELGTVHWLSPNDGATDEYRFTALPSGRKVAGGLFSSGTSNGYWWAATESNSANAWVRTLDYDHTTFGDIGIQKEAGHSVRCVEDINTETDIIGFTLPEQYGPANIDAINHIIDIEVNYGTNLTSLTPTIELSTDATISPLSGTAQDFTSFFIYTVTAEDGVTEQNWTVIVTVTTTPTISVFSPREAGNGTTVTIDGTNFIGTTAVNFGGNAATSFNVNSDTRITAIVDAGATGDISVTTPNGVATIGGFNFIPTPIINSLTPLSGPVGSEVIISGNNFSTTQPIQLTEALLTGGGTKIWKLRPAAGSIGVGPEVGSESFWPWGADISGERPCLFNDEFIFKAGGIYEYQANGDIYGEPYMGLSEGCQDETNLMTTSPDASAWGSGIHSFIFTEATTTSNALITVSGTGAFIGLPKAYNEGSYSTAPPLVDGTVTYEVIDYLNDGVNETLILSIDISTDGSLFWKFVLSKDGANVFIPPPNSIEFNGASTTATSTTVNELKVTVPTGATSGTISVTVLDQSATSGDSFAVLSSETDILSFSLADQTSDATINTTNHTVDIEVFNGTDASNLSPTITYSTGASISPLSGAAMDFTNPVIYTITAEDGVTTQDWTVTVRTISNAIPTISSFTPSSGAVGSTVTITGANFNPVPANNVVFFGTTSAIVTAASASQLSVTVPVGASYQPITVISNGLIAYSSTPFNVTYTGGGMIDETSFNVKLDFATKSNPHSVAIGDLDGDGKSDMVVANSNSATISIFRNTTHDNSVEHTLSVDDYTAIATSTSASNPLGSSNLYTFGNFNLTLWSFSEINNAIGDRLLELFPSAAVDDAFLVTYATYEPLDGTRSVLMKFDGSMFTADNGIITYAPKNDIITGSAPRSIALGDYDGDGKVDIAVANIASNSVSVYRNTSATPGSISFTAKIDFITGTAPICIASGDLDSDGKVDLVVANVSSNSISVLRNTSSGAEIINFAAKADYSTGIGPLSIAVADLDSDGKLDITVANENDNTISIFRNTSSVVGTVGFAPKIDLTTGIEPESVAAGDLDGDNMTDLVVANYGSASISVFRNANVSPGSISFDTKEDYAAGENPFSVSIGNLNGDSAPDLAVANSGSNTLSVFENSSTVTGTISFADKLDYLTNLAPISVAIGDLDGDRRPDIAVANYNNDNVSVFRNAIIAQSDVDRAALMALYNSTDGANWTNKTNWGTGSDLSTWYGVTTDINGSVITLDLRSNNLNGPLPSELGNMENLLALILRKNSLSGTIPIELGNLANLEGLDLAFNNLSGSIPIELGSLINLGGLTLDFNAFTGTIPTELTNLINLRSIYLGGNQLQGAVPSGFGNIPGLETFNLFDNQLDVLPDFSAASWAGNILNFSVENNKFSFDDLVPNKGINGFSYSPQKLVDNEISAVVYTNHEYILTVNESDANTYYDWKKDGAVMGGVGQQNVRTITGFSSLDVGTYTCEMTNTQFPGLTITRNNIILTENTDPIAHFIFSGDAIDQTGNGHDGTIVGATSGIDRFANANAAYHFDGIKDYIKTASDGFLNTNEQGCFYFWFFIEEMRPTQMLFSYNENDASYGAIVYVKDNFIKFQYSVPGTQLAASFTGISAINAGMWYQVAISNDLSGQTKLFLNGIEETFSFDNGGTAANGTEWMADLAMTPTSHVSIGGFYHNNNVEFPTLGSIDDVRIYNRGLVPLEVYNLYVAETSIPTITSFSPTSAGTGETVTITGTNLGTTTEVNFSGMAATSFNIVSNSSVEAVVGEGDPTPGYVFITTTSGVASLDGFTYLPSLIINSFTPTSGETGTDVTIEGNGFSEELYLAGNSVTFNGVEAVIKSITSTALVVTVPFDITSGKIEVNLNGQTATSVDNFIIIPTITAQVFPATYNEGEDLVLELGLNNPATANAVRLVGKGISQSDLEWTTSAPITPDQNSFKVTISSATLTDPIGIEYYFTIEYTNGQLTSDDGTSFINYPASGTTQVIPDMSFGDQVENYQIIAVPLELENYNVSSVFDELMPYDKTLWRLFDFSNGNNREYSGFTTIDVGKGYWLIVRNSTQINPGGGSAVRATNSFPFNLTLVPGWNLIGNPYNFRISWQDVLDFNGNYPEISDLITFRNGTLNANATLDKYRGGFVFNDGSTSIAIDIPVTKTTGGRLEEDEKPTDLSESYWELQLNLIQGKLRNEVGGIGMHPKATLRGKDRFDEVAVPMLADMGFFELGFEHPEYNTHFNKEIVPTKKNYTWEIDVIRTNNTLPLLLNWDNSNLGVNENQLYLYDPTTLQVIDMRVQHEYEVGTSSKRLQILFGEHSYIESQLNGAFPLAGEPYPNPTTGAITLPYKIEGKNPSNVSYRVFDNMGKLLIEHSEMMNSGIHNYECQFEKAGLYIVQIQIDEKTISKKIIVN